MSTASNEEDLMTDEILEEFSKTNQSKPGRPRRWVRWVDDPGFRSLYQEIRSERGMLNKALACGALRALSPDGQHQEEFRWIVSSEVFRATILTELGRVCADFGDESCRTLARVICERKASARDAVRFCRRFREKQRGVALRKPPSRDRLQGLLCSVIDRFLADYPGFTLPEVGRTLEEVFEVVEFLRRSTPAEEGRP